MDNLKNVIAAISLSLAVIVFYTLFFSNPNQESDNLSKDENKTLIENSETPTIEEKIEVKKISRDEAMNSSERIYFENNFVNILKCEYDYLHEKMLMTYKNGVNNGS